MSSSTAACRSCGAALHETFVDLGMAPLSQSHIEPVQLNAMEAFYPLHVWVCERCFLVQLEQYVAPANIFTEYAYFSSYSDTWVEHARRYCTHMKALLSLGANSKVMEIASNDGYLLQHFVSDGIPCLGIEPAANVAKVAIEKGVPTEVQFLGAATAQAIAARHGRADLLLGNNVLAHVPDINDFVAGMKILLAPGGTITMEFPHLLQLMEKSQFDTIYHEHFSYLSFMAASAVFARHELRVFDVEELPTHGGSIRIYARHVADTRRAVTSRATAMLQRERSLGFDQLETYAGFGRKVIRLKHELLTLLIRIKGAGKRIAGYGAPGKGNTLLNYCGIRDDFLDYTVDRNPYKQGKYTPGTHIPIVDPAKLRETKPDFVLILPWNLQDEITTQHAYISEWGGKFIVPIPEPRVI